MKNQQKNQGSTDEKSEDCNKEEESPLLDFSVLENLSEYYKRLVQKPLTIFDPEIVNKTLYQVQSKIVEKFFENPANWEDMQKAYWGQHESLVKSTLLRLSGDEGPTIISPESGDKRFRHESWNNQPIYDYLKQSYLLHAKFLKGLVESLEGVDEKTRQKINFYTRHYIDALSPTNFPQTNPEVLKEMLDSKGESLLRGLKNLMHDINESKGYAPLRMTATNAFKIGENLATTPGKIVFQNDLIQLIQYLPTTEKVKKLPLLMIPPWINKYYIFDLKAENSFVKWALNEGLTIFIISWVNPDESHAETSLSDYVFDGLNEAIQQVREITGEEKINALGYCAGGILLNSLLAYHAKIGINLIASATVVATPIDFDKAGDLMVYICEEQLDKLEKHVLKKGYLEAKSMIMTFNMLRANELVWSFYINNYLMGRDPFPFDLLYWNSDATRMPGKMHIEYLRKILLENGLTHKNKVQFKGVGIDLSEIKIPLFIMASIDDHIAPWKSAYPLYNMSGGNNVFILGASGHVAGVINHPDKNKYHYWTNSSKENDPDKWFEGASEQPGSWWPEWLSWIQNYSGSSVPGRIIDERRVIEETPGSYALQSFEE